jgi:hypothetical protein
MQRELERFIHWVRMRNPQAQVWWDYQCNMNLFMTVMILDWLKNDPSQGGDNGPEHSSSVRSEYRT